LQSHPNPKQFQREYHGIVVYMQSCDADHTPQDLDSYLKELRPECWSYDEDERKLYNHSWNFVCKVTSREEFDDLKFGQLESTPRVP